VLALTELPRDLLPADGAEKEMAIRVRLVEEAAFTVRLGFETASGPALTDWSVAQ